jgi:large subunit ribosomal protein L28
MSKICAITGKKPMKGNNVSHAKNRTKRTFKINLQNKRLWSEAQQKYIRLKVTTAAIRLIDKIGLDEAMKSAKDKD